MISENTIDHIIRQFDAGEIDHVKAVRELAGRQPALLSFILAGMEGALTNDEKDYLLYLALVIWRAVEYEMPGIAKVNAKAIVEKEEANWAMLESNKNHRFRQRLDVFFENTTQEDLLAFIEDSLTPENEPGDSQNFRVSPEGAAPMFVILKTVVDVLTAET